jgi:hypothetical protein
VDASCLAYRFRSISGGAVAVVEVMRLLIESVLGVVLVLYWCLIPIQDTTHCQAGIINGIARRERSRETFCCA